MTFANVSANREQLTWLSQLLLTMFPGCVIHQSRDPMRTMKHLSTQKVDAVFADEGTYHDLMRLLNGQASKTSVYLLCRQDLIPSEEMGGSRNVITYPLTQQKIQVALLTVPQEVREVV